MTRQTTLVLALSLFESREVARQWLRRYHAMMPSWLRQGVAICLCLAIVYLTILWALITSRLTAARFDGTCGAIVWPC